MFKIDYLLKRDCIEKHELLIFLLRSPAFIALPMNMNETKGKVSKNQNGGLYGDSVA